MRRRAFAADGISIETRSPAAAAAAANKRMQTISYETGSRFCAKNLPRNRYVCGEGRERSSRSIVALQCALLMRKRRSIIVPGPQTALRVGLGARGVIQFGSASKSRRHVNSKNKPALSETVTHVKRAINRASNCYRCEVFRANVYRTRTYV